MVDYDRTMNSISDIDRKITLRSIKRHMTDVIFVIDTPEGEAGFLAEMSSSGDRFVWKVDRDRIITKNRTIISNKLVEEFLQAWGITPASAVKECHKPIVLFRTEMGNDYVYLRT